LCNLNIRILNLDSADGLRTAFHQSWKLIKVIYFWLNAEIQSEDKYEVYIHICVQIFNL